MPAQTPTVGRAYYQQHDTAPNLRRQLLDGDGEAINLGTAPPAGVFIDIAYSSYDYYYSPMAKLVDDGVCIVENQAVPASVGWVQWAPQVGDLDVPGSHQFRFKIVWPDGTIQHVPPNTYEMLIVSTPVGGFE